MSITGEKFEYNMPMIYRWETDSQPGKGKWENSEISLICHIDFVSPNKETARQQRYVEFPPFDWIREYS